MAFRTIAYNVMKCTGYPPDANGHAPDAHLATPEAYAAALAAYAPDIVTLAECPDEAAVEEIAARLGMRCVAFPSPGRWPGALLTRFDVVSADNCPHVAGERPPDDFTRHWGRAVLDVGGTALAVHSVHLHPVDAAAREREVLAVLERVREDQREGAQVVVQGDFNHRPDMPEYQWWWNAGLFDTFEPDTGDDGHTYRSDLPMARLDYVWVERSLAERVVRGRPLNEPPFVPDASAGPSGRWALSDHIPQLAVIDPPAGDTGHLRGGAQHRG
ncbi:MAG: endonuclease/exonuclease/phosphatase family protein [Dehalococcoidia bacterium]